MTQGEIGFILQNTIQSALRKRGIKRPVVTLITQVVVDSADPAFQNPTKPIGPFYSRAVAEQKRSDLGWNIIEDAARGYRRVVPSPLPRDIVELDVIQRCIEQDIIVITVGGGGIPVVEHDGAYRGVEAVIDKDRASSLLATKLNVQQFIISTDVENVCLNYKKPDQTTLHAITDFELNAHLQEGHFQEGSMRPKIEAALQFLHGGGETVIITNPEHIPAALDKKTGTIITHRAHDHET
jgi:carbamate kinase